MEIPAKLDWGRIETMARRWIGFLTVFVLLSGVIGFVRWKWFGVAIRDLAVEFTFVFLMLSLGILRVLFPKIRLLVDKGMSYYWKSTLTLLLGLGPISGFLAISKFVVGKSAPMAQIAFFILSLAVWLACLKALATDKWRESLFRRLSQFGWLSPFIFLFNYLIISVILFATGSFLIGAVWHITKPPVELASLDAYLNVFGWYLLDAIPTLDITHTLQLHNPLPIEQPLWLGLIILFFKFAVIISGIGAFAAYWKSAFSIPTVVDQTK
jgi:hypothetical protein